MTFNFDDGDVLNLGGGHSNLAPILDGCSLWCVYN